MPVCVAYCNIVIQVIAVFCNMCSNYAGLRVDTSFRCPVCDEALDESYCKESLCDKCSTGVPYDRETVRKQHINHEYDLEYYVYWKMYNEQGAGCWICGKGLSLYKGDSDAPTACVDHDHKTGEVRGLLCRNCNTMIGMAEENIGRLFAAANYLKRFK